MYEMIKTNLTVFDVNIFLFKHTVSSCGTKTNNLHGVSRIQTVGLEVTPLSMFMKMHRPHIPRSALQCWKWIRLFLWVLFLVNRAHL